MKETTISLLLEFPDGDRVEIPPPDEADGWVLVNETSYKDYFDIVYQALDLSEIERTIKHQDGKLVFKEFTPRALHETFRVILVRDYEREAPEETPEPEKWKNPFPLLSGEEKTFKLDEVVDVSIELKKTPAPINAQCTGILKKGTATPDGDISLVPNGTGILKIGTKAPKTDPVAPFSCADFNRALFAFATRSARYLQWYNSPRKVIDVSRDHAEHVSHYAKCVENLRPSINCTAPVTPNRIVFREQDSKNTLFVYEVTR